MSKHHSVVIVGGGISGLSAAKLLHESGIDVLVLEASSRVGGRLYTLKNEKVGGYLDVGGEFVCTAQHRLMSLSQEFGVKTTPVYCKNYTLCYRDARLQKFLGPMPTMRSIGGKLDYYHLLRSLHKLCNEIPMDQPWNAKRAEALDQLSYQEWLEKTVSNRSVIANAAMLARSNFSAEPYEVSLLWALWDMKAAGGMREMNASGEGAQETTFIGGSQQIPEKIAQQLSGRILLDKPVCKIRYESNRVYISTVDGLQIEADYVILAMPPAAQLRIVFEPSLPSARDQLTRRMPMGSVIKTFMFYSKTFWREKGLSGTLFVEDDVLDHPVVTTVDETKPDGSYPCIMGFIVANKARVLSPLTKEERKQKIAKQYATMFDCKEMEEPVHYEEMDWSTDNWAGGGYAGFLPPGMLTVYGRALRQPVGRLHFAGTEAANTWPGYIEGAIESGQRAAKEILFEMGKCTKDAINPSQDELDETVEPTLSFIERNCPSKPKLIRTLASMGLTAVAGRFIWSKL